MPSLDQEAVRRANKLEQSRSALTGRQSELRADQVRWDLAPTPCLSSGPVLAVAGNVLPVVADDIAADVIEQLALALVDRDEQLKSLSTVLSVALELLHVSETQTARLRKRVAELLQTRRREVSA